MRTIIYPETICRLPPIFLGGSTSKGDWQQVIQDLFANTAAVFINTCRPDWDVKEPTREEKNDHIEWEFDWLDRTRLDFICVPADAKSPTVLLELGIAITKPLSASHAVVFIDPGYSHFHNARIACETAGVHVYTDFDEAVEKLKDLFLTSW